jgi:large subunit ribosomal protein L6
MSRVGRMPITVPEKVKIEIDGRRVTVRGPGGELSREIAPEIALRLEDRQLIVSRSSDAPRDRALHGLTRSLIANMVTGVDGGFSKMLELYGVGYRGEMRGQNVVLSLGYSHPVEVPPPPGITLQMEGTNRLLVKGADKEAVGQTAADIRALRPPEPYKGKGIRYAGEYVRRKAGKAGKAAR